MLTNFEQRMSTLWVVYTIMNLRFLTHSIYSFNPYSANRKCHLFITLCCIYSNALKTNFVMEANIMDPDQTAAYGAV